MARLTDKQLKEIASKMLGSSGNVYQYAKLAYKKEFEEPDWARMEKLTGVFRCEECSTWNDKAMKEPSRTSTCVDCARDEGAEDHDD